MSLVSTKIEGSMESLADASSILVEKILMWPFTCQPKNLMFSEDTITLFRNTSESIETNRFRRNIGVLSGASTGIVGSGLMIASTTVAPFLLGLGLGVVGPVAAMGALYVKNYRDQSNRERVTKDLENFTKIQYDVVRAFNLVIIAYRMTETLHNFVETQPKLNSVDLAKQVKDLVDEIAHFENIKSVDILDKLKYVTEYAKKIVVHLVKTLESYGSLLYANETQFRQELKQAEETPFEYLESSIKILKEMVNFRDVISNSSFGGFVLNLHGLMDNYKTKGKPITDVATSAMNDPTRDTMAENLDDSLLNDIATNESSPTKGAKKSTGGAIAAAKYVASGAAKAGLALGAVGLLGDVFFAGYAAYDLTKLGYDQKEALSQALLDVAQSMEDINKFLISQP